MANHLTYEVLNQLVDGRASALEEARAQRHLSRCGRCRSEREWLQRIRGWPARGFQEPPEPPDDSARSTPRANMYWHGHPA